jgi:hypothetical protein
MNRVWIAAGAALLLAAPGAQAGVGQGDVEIGASISLTSQERELDTGFGTSTTKSDSGNVSLSGGYFYTDMIEFKLALNMSVSTDVTTGSINPGADFLFAGGSDLVPFAGASYGLAVGDITDTDFLEFHGGFKYFFRERASFEVKLARFEAMDSDVEAGHTDLSAGLNFYF